jgi:predicted nucleic-acid-binding Zn-ribbon protein
LEWAPSVSKGGVVVEQKQYVCPKCGCKSFVHDQFQATGGNFAKIFDVQNKKFVTVSCAACGYTELYRMQTSTGWNVLDFLIGG